MDGSAGTAIAAVEILPVAGRRMLNRFIRLPHRLHRDDPAYIAPLDSEQRKALSPKSNPLFLHAEAAFWLARRDGRDVGRISAQIDRQALRVRPDATGFFGMIAAEDDPAIFAALLRTAEDWLVARGMRRIQGPFNLSINEQIGLLVEGFDTPPMLMMNHDLPYVAGRLEEQGYAKEKDLLAYSYNVQGDLPPVPRRLASRPLPAGMLLRQGDASRYNTEIRAVAEIFNDAWAGNWGFVPLTDAEIDHLAKALKPLLDPRLVWFVEDQGQPIGFIVALPNLNEAIRDLGGRLLPFGWIKLLWRLKVAGTKSFRVPLMGIKRRYATGMAAGILPFALIHATRESARAMGMNDAELSWVLEDNWAMRHIGDALGGSAYKTYRVYSKALP